ncbi:hypothetical protein GCM10012275_24800 [Longimycelium tulufanense]|uniref:DUF4286 domain-containing protein n=1 Tax=Longimycelium tulufanense TaxID=907463 RepID=A0A8J3C862_9PSEU|nr:DUF4286 family protein [Longimycelium tulufanense]GGM52856.1 hypothetical protein GCM10012275_24800 [Longimycelium tulufanense]
MIVYSVRATFDDDSMRDAFLSWLCSGHAAAVVEAGALDAEVLVHEDGSTEARYHFADRAAFDAYLAGPAERLRAETTEKFRLGENVRLTREISEVAYRLDDRR